MAPITNTAQTSAAAALAAKLSHGPVVQHGADAALFAAFVVNTRDIEPRPEPAPAKPVHHEASAETDHNYHDERAPQRAEKPEEPRRTEPVKAEEPAKKETAEQPDAAPAGKKETAVAKAAHAKTDDAHANGSETPDADAVLAVVAAPFVKAVKAAKQDVKAEEPTVDTMAVADSVIKQDAGTPLIVAPKAKKKDNDDEQDDAILALAPLQSATIKAHIKADAQAGKEASQANEQALLPADADAAADNTGKQKPNTTLDAAKDQHPLAVEGRARNTAAQSNAAGGSNTGQNASPLPGQPTAAAIAAAGVATPAASKAAGATSAANPNINADAALRPALLAQNSESGRAQHAKLARLPVQTLTQVQEQIAIKLRYTAKAGEKQMTIKLSPEDLGNVEVKLDFRDGNKVQAKVTVDNPFTLELLQKDSKSLERALNDAGLQLDTNGLQFDLKEGGQQRQSDLAKQGGWSSDWAADSAEQEINVSLVDSAIASGSIGVNGRVDIVI